MAGRAIVDTGLLVALLNEHDRHHRWAAGLLPSLRGPWLTAEACVSEAVFLLEQAGKVAVERLLGWLEKGLVETRHFLPEELAPVQKELLGYGDRWVDFADACFVRLSDQYPRLPLVTVDASDFGVYFRKRQGRRLVLPGRAR